MPNRTEWEIRTTIVEAIQAAASDALVIPYDILDVRIDNSGQTQLASLRLPSDQDRVHAWMVTQIAAPTTVSDKRTYAEYSYRYAVWQFFYYAGGDADTCSEHLASTERDAVIAAFAGKDATSLCSGISPLSFDVIGTFFVVDQLVHIAQGSLSVTNIMRP